MPLPKMTAEQFRHLIAPALSIAGTVAALTPTKVDDTLVLGVQKVSENDLAVNAVVNLINRLAGTLEANNGQLGPGDLAGIHAAIEALPC
ncbi:MAG: hypothetical protein U0836_16200 [Pirellulales bacterium]